MNPIDDITWVAQRTGQDWVDQETLAAVDWLVSLVPKQVWEARAARTEAVFQAAKAEWAAGRRVPLFDPKDSIAWYIHQARCYADAALRGDFFEPQGYRIAPLFLRLGQLLPYLKQVTGADERGAHLITDGKAQPDDVIYELLVAGTYKKRGWQTVDFVEETPGMGKQPDIFVGRGKSSWAVECKRAGRSEYSHNERVAGERMAELAHKVSRDAARPVIVIVKFNAELEQLPLNYLSEKVLRFLDGDAAYEWSEDESSGVVYDVDWQPLNKVLVFDDVYFGSSRMIELLLGRYVSSADYSVDGDWEPGEKRPLHATSVQHVSLIAWTITSMIAAQKKARHFRGIIGGASKQLPGDRPGVIHVGYEELGGNSAEGLRHRLNVDQMRSFDGSASKLRWVYGNYFMPEHVTAKNESSAVTETMAFYRIGGTKTKDPLPNHMLFVDNDGEIGFHFRR